MPEESWEEWLENLDAPRRQRVEKLRDAFVSLGADEPESWVRSEINEDIAQLTRYLFLSAVWRRLEWAVAGALECEPARRLAASGCDTTIVEAVVRTAVYDVASGLCYLLDEPDGTSWLEDGSRRSDVEPHHRRWELREIEPDGPLTGRDVGDLHESLADTDPSGHGGADWYRYL